METKPDNQPSYLTPEVLLSMFERTPLGKAIIGLDFRFLEVNPALCGMLGYSAEELKRMTFVEVTHPDDINADVVLARKLLAGEISHFQMEKRYIQKDGTVFWVNLTAYMLRDEEGRPVRALSMVENIDERKRQENELLASRELLRRTGEIARVGGWEVEFPSRRRRWTDEVFKIHDLPVGDYPDREKYWDAVESPYREQLREAYQKCSVLGTPYDIEAPLTTAAGRKIWVRCNAQARIVDGVVQSVFGTIQEITERKAAEENLRSAHEALARANAELLKSAQQASTLLEHAKMADHAKGEFLAVMSHEIRTPLNAMLGMSTLLAGSKELNAEQRDYVDTILTSGEALLTLISDILDYSKLDAGVMQLEEQPCDVVDLAAACMGLIAEHAEGKGLELELIVARDTPRMVFADIGRLRQILLNLLSNAIKFTSAGHICLRVGVIGITGSRKVFFTVEDSGIGIDPERIGGLFNPFFQADLSITRKFGGTGLGLVISKRIAVAMGGDITVESRLGEGSKFTAYIQPRELAGVPPSGKGSVTIVSERPRTSRSLASLYEFMGAEVQLTESVEAAQKEMSIGNRPDVLVIDHEIGESARELLPRVVGIPSYLLVPVNRSSLKCLGEGFTGRTLFPPRVSAMEKSLEAGDPAHAEAAAPTSTRTSRVAFDGSLGSRNPLRILVAEDNHANQQVIRVLLKRMGYDMELARNGLEAIEAWRRTEFDLIFMDVHMPEMDGMTATESIRGREVRGKRNRCRIIALTADARPETIKECVAAGMDGYLTKPLNATAIQDVLSSTRV